MQNWINKIHQGDCLEVLRKMPDKLVNMCITSPPYWALRDYGDNTFSIWDGKLDCKHEWGSSSKESVRFSNSKWKNGNKITPEEELHEYREREDTFCSKCGAWKGQLGLEPTFELFIKHLCDIFDEVKRVLRDDGTLWVNISDTYNSGGNYRVDGSSDRGHKYNKREFGRCKFNPEEQGMSKKCLIGIPFRFVIEMINRGWILRNTIIWHKPNCMPSSAKDRFTVDFEYIFFFSKKKKYYFETQLVPLAESTLKDKRLNKGLVAHKSGKTIEDNCQYSIKGMCANSFGRNKRSVWKIPTKPFKGAHFATYPENLIKTPIKAGCPKHICNKCGKPREKIFDKKLIKKGNSNSIRKVAKINNVSESSCFRTNDEYCAIEKGYSKCSCNAGFRKGIVLDPFMGSGTTGLVALKQNKNFIGIEISQEYCDIANARLKPHLEQRRLL